MKKLLCAMMAIILMLPCFLTIPVAAAEEDWTSDEQFMQMAKKTFPEYSDKLEKNASPYKKNMTERAATDVTVAVKETRAVDKNTVMTYTEYDNGLVTLAAARFNISKDLIIHDSETHSNYELFTATIKASVVEGPSFTAKNLQYKIYPSDYDRIVSIGDYSIPNYSKDEFVCRVNKTETADRCAYVYYEFAAPVGGEYYGGRVVFELYQNQTYVDFMILQ